MVGASSLKEDLPLNKEEVIILTKEQIDSHKATQFLTDNNQEEFSKLISSGYKVNHLDLEKLLQNIYYDRMTLTDELNSYINDSVSSLNSFYKKEFLECSELMDAVKSPNDRNFKGYEKISNLVHVAVRLNSLDESPTVIKTEDICSNKDLYSFLKKAHTYIYLCYYNSDYDTKYENFSSFKSFKEMDLWCVEKGLQTLANYDPSIKFKLAVESITKLREQSKNESGSNLKIT